MTQNFKQNHINPKQPYFVLVAEYYYKLVVMDYRISHFYCYKTNDTIQSEALIVPDGCVDILFCCDKDRPWANVCGTVLSPKLLINEKNKYYFGVRFLPGYNPLLGKSIIMPDLITKEVPFQELIGDNDLYEKITTSNDFRYQAQVFMDYYMKLYSKTEINIYQNALKDYVLTEIINTAGNVKLNTLAEKSGYTTRYINKVFTQELGLSPKIFSRMMRFQHLLGMLNSSAAHVDLSHFAVDMGFCDQSHMMKDFRQFTNTTPGKYLHTLQETKYKQRLIIL